MAKLRIPVSPADHAQGAADAPVTLVEYGDYECPHCGRAYPIIKRVQQAMGPRMRLIYRNFPISEAHPHAVNAAAAAEAAALQGKFWPMHDRLFEHQQHLDDASLLRYARDLGLDVAKFEADYATEAVGQRITTDFEGGVRSGVNGTPTFFINGIRHEEGFDYEVLLAAVEKAAK